MIAVVPKCYKVPSPTWLRDLNFLLLCMKYIQSYCSYHGSGHTTLNFYVQVFQKFVSQQPLIRKNSHLDRNWTFLIIGWIYSKVLIISTQFSTYYQKSSKIYWSPLVHCFMRCICLCIDKLRHPLYLSLSSVPKKWLFFFEVILLCKERIQRNVVYMYVR